MMPRVVKGGITLAAIAAVITTESGGTPPRRLVTEYDEKTATAWAACQLPNATASRTMPAHSNRPAGMRQCRALRR